MENPNGGGVKMNKTCDQCRQRKIRCIVPETPSGSQPRCTYCIKRGIPCYFSVFRRKARFRVANSLPASSRPSGKVALGELFVDRVLQHGPQDVVLSDESAVFTSPDEKVPSCGLAFFSEQKVASLNQRIGNSRVQDVVQRLDDFILNRLGIPDASSWPPIPFHKPMKRERITSEEATGYIQAFFVNLHPVYPFLDREEFEAQAFDPNLTAFLHHNPVFSALYHCILALGSQFLGCGTFEPGKGRSWELFQVAISHMSDIIIPRESIESVQALVAMSIYAMNSCALQLDGFFLSHAARMVVELRYHKNVSSEPKHLRVFWVIYALEKQQGMHCRTCSIIPDEDIGCVIPPFPEAQYENFNWFVSLIQIGRITSIIYTSLFSVSASLRSRESSQSTIEQVHEMLEAWRQSIPAEIRPGSAAQFPVSAPPSTNLAALHIHFSYYHTIIALDRLSLYLNRDGGSKAQSSKQRLMSTARTVIELTKHIDIQPQVPMFILAVLPVSAVFILFDLVIHNPFHRESRTNLSLLDSAAGYFALMGIASNHSMPGSIMPEFTHIAREYFWKVQHQKGTVTGRKKSAAEAPPEDNNTMEKPVVAQEVNMKGSPSYLTGSPTFQMEPLIPSTTTDPGIRVARGCSHPSSHTGSVDSDYLEYPTPIAFDAASDFQIGESVDLRTLFGWGFPAGGTSMMTMDEWAADPMNFEPAAGVGELELGTDCVGHMQGT
ncbi:hypothetical protein RJZ56_006884 [Blastomyces dermatitidis]|uniref:Zn(2)-C6 fungal-type domain-containing protein n=1 Tax=Ajellomyces dermatitidis (strain ER-3 / ATCC MYA-2586) TaxID=559297 RepID=A0ABP2EPI2_AJEDR|nr:uncharacterized protein BDCG_08710 [Blastomyces dermatitidis ER-3]EEQ85441.2 hypothetical protein BDCG_08710 [Blastomyces dermatitidis ER-3]EQL33537.1 hypothetical protein, variant 1 [Blastomyces dermatitidis ATCC 26199]EQL33538.1 hypothetical protein, variant 2 [Blastomyces dermatitidis ATCC 26199]EQL33539.1 hypothetical protein, variant 3 [Blastomyces dermatitidis ATCC 26199]